MPVLLHLGISTTSGGVGFECLQPSLYISGKLCVSSSCLSSSSSDHVSGGTCQRSTQMFDSGGTMFIIDISLGQTLKGLPYLHLTLWLLSDVCYVDRGSLPQSQAVAGAAQASMSKVYQQCWKEWAGWCTQKDEPINAISAPKLANFWCIYFRLAMAWHTIGIYQSAISAILEPHHLHKASNLPVISKLMCHFYLQHPPCCKCFDPWDVEHLLSLMESWAPASSLTTFKLAWKTATL